MTDKDRRRRPALVFRGPHGVQLTIDGRITILIFLAGLIAGSAATLWALGYVRC